MQLASKGSGGPNYPWICPNFGFKEQYYLKGGGHFNQIGSNSISNRNTFIYKEMSTTCERGINCRVINCPHWLAYRIWNIWKALDRILSVLSRKYLCSNVMLECRHWFHMLNICPFYGQFGIESVPDPLMLRKWVYRHRLSKQSEVTTTCL